VRLKVLEGNLHASLVELIEFPLLLRNPPLLELLVSEHFDHPSCTCRLGEPLLRVLQFLTNLLDPLDRLEHPLLLAKQVPSMLHQHHDVHRPGLLVRADVLVLIAHFLLDSRKIRLCRHKPLSNRRQLALPLPFRPFPLRQDCPKFENESCHGNRS
jgi:hypothetical protein